MLKKLYILLSFSFFSTYLFANIDSLVFQLELAKGKEKVDLLIEISKKKARMEEVDEAIFLSKTLNYGIGLSRAYRRKALLILNNEGNHYEVKRLYEKAILITQKLNNQYEYTDCLNSMGTYYFTIGTYSKAHAFFIKALQISEKNDYDLLMTLSLSNLASLFYTQNNFKKAIEYSLKALKLNEEGCDKFIPHHLTILGASYMDLGDYKNAEKYLKKALEKHTQYNNKELKVTTLISLGQLYYFQEKYSTSLVYFDDALNLSRVRNIQHKVAYSLTMIAKVNIKLNKYHLALENLIEANQIAKNGGFIIEQQKANLQLSNVYEKFGNYKKSLHHFKVSETIKDSLNSEKFSKQILKLQFNYNLEKKEGEIIIEKQKVKILKQNNKIEKSRNRIFIEGIITLIIVIIFLLIIQRIRKKRNKALTLKNKIIHQSKQETSHLELEIKNKELTTYTLQTIQKNGLLLDIKKQVKQVISENEANQSNKLLKLVNKINYSFNLDKDWDEFRMYFENVHKEFFDSIKKQYPLLTEKDLKLCALFKLGLSSKQAASLLGISPTSINISRYRLRKKMNLSQDDNLIEIIKLV